MYSEWAKSNLTDIKNLGWQGMKIKYIKDYASEKNVIVSEIGINPCYLIAFSVRFFLHNLNS